MDKRITASTVARIAGNIAGQLVDRNAIMYSADRLRVAECTVALAIAIVDETLRQTA